jgi:hypothetical protein
MFHLREKITLEQLLKDKKITKKQVAKALEKSPRWVSELLSRDIELLQVRQIKDILKVANLNLSMYLEQEL